jgi:hypothetical protein
MVLMGAVANAAPLGATFVQCSADGNSSFDSTECNIGGFPGVPASMFASATLSPIPGVTVQATAPTTAVFGAGGDASSFYYFDVIGGNPGDIVPLMIDFNLGVFSTAESWALARMMVRTTLGAPVVEELGCNPQVCDEATLSSTLSTQALSGSNVNSITLYAAAQATATGISNESARAFADPYIYVDPAFANASLYSIVVSPGVANVPVRPAPGPDPGPGPNPSPVPEPATLSLVGSALGVFSLLRRRDKSRRR